MSAIVDNTINHALPRLHDIEAISRDNNVRMRHSCGHARHDSRNSDNDTCMNWRVLVIEKHRPPFVGKAFGGILWEPLPPMDPLNLAQF
jgi:hypothetical protein